MRSAVKALAGLIAVAVSSAVSAGQDASAPILLSAPPTFGPVNAEANVVASTRDPNQVVVAWNSIIAVGLKPRLHYRVSITGFLGALPPGPPLLEFPNEFGTCPPCGGTEWLRSADPAVGRSLITGDLFLGAVFTRNTLTEIGTLGIARKPFGSTITTLEGLPGQPTTPMVRSMSPCFGFLDRPIFAIGPKPPDLPSYTAPEALYVTFTPLNTSVALEGRIHSGRALPSATLGAEWECTGNQANGYPARIATYPLAPHVPLAFSIPATVTESGVRAGRLITATMPHTSNPQFFGSGLVTSNPPEVTWTDKGGGAFQPSPYLSPWANAIALDRYGENNTPLLGIRDGPQGTIPAPRACLTDGGASGIGG